MNKHLWVAAIAVVLPSIASAQEVNLPPIVVTASRTAQTVDETLAAVTVITREDIERQQAQTVTEVLRGTPGLTISNSGGAGKQSSVFLRGTKSDHVVVLVDGVKIGSATVAGISWQDLPVEQIERIEVVRGPRSSLYGSEAIGGVIQIFTRRGGGETRVYGSVGAGSNDTYQSQVGISGGGERRWLNLGVSHHTTAGFNACNASAGCGAVEPDDDGYRNTAAQLRVGGRIGKTGELDLSALRAWGHTEFDGSWENSNDFVEQVIGGRFAFAPLAPWRVTLAAGNNRSERDYFLDGDFTRYLDTSRDVASLQNDFSLSDHQLLTLGADYQRDKVDATYAYSVRSRDNRALFTQYQATFGKHSILLAGRHDDNEQFGEHDTGNIAWAYAFTPDLRLLTSAGTAFKAPTFDDLYDSWLGNPDLQPERARSAEVGLQGRHWKADWAVSIFRTEIDDLIVSNPPAYVPYNIEQARIDGLEARLSRQILSWTVAANLTLLDHENRSAGDSKGKQLPRRARQSGRVDIDRSFGAFSFGGSVFAEGSRYDDAANTLKLGGYGIADLRLGYAFSKDWRVQAELSNVFDKEYETVAFYNQPGRVWFIGLHYAPTAR
ncbi:MAG TPA: TonB-dependent vitamin B12 receptor [Gammaproteobacteria bacterium]|nr:TonB-dependent vitamin B12 receptor [Gammaproteobacteria bacterium]